jgi:hypothetical protein
MRGLVVIALVCAGAFACSRSELFGFDDSDLAFDDAGPDASTLADAEEPDDAADATIDSPILKELHCPPVSLDVCGGNAYQPGAPWPTYQRCSSHASRTNVVGPKNPTVLWSQWTDLSETSFGPLTIDAKGTLYVSPFGGLSAFAHDGTFLYNAGPNGYGTPAPGGPVLGGPNAYGTSPVAVGPDGTAYTADDAVYAVNADGTQKWTSPSFNAFVSVAYGFGGSSGSSVSLGPCGILDVGTPIGMLAFDPQTGTPLWAHDDVVISSPAIDAAGNIYYQNVKNQLVALAIDGTLLWTFTPPDMSATRFPWIEAAPVLGEDGTIYFGELTGLYAVRKDGSLLWELPWGFDAHASASYLAMGLGSDGTIYAVAPDGSVRAVSAEGIEQWSLSIGANGTAPVIDGAGTIYELGEYGLYTITPGGQIASIFPIYFAPNGALAMGSDGTLYVSAFGVFAIGDAP